ncbi:MAG: YqgE/AlgH family protein [Rhizobiales bacterium]|nr:YqgE/AlgH family protein [Hyphomicrobiales bacterium]
MTTPRTKRRKRNDSCLKGQLLVAMPLMSDRRFARSVIYICAHSDDGAMGLIINHCADHISFHDLLERLGIIPKGAEEGIANDILERQVHVGGPVETGRGFVLHSSDYHSSESTLPIDRDVSLTASIEILKAMAQGEGPGHAMLALGYAGWSAGQLENEIQANGWLHCPPDLNLLFDADVEGKYARALAKIGVDPSHLVSDAGHA